MDEPFWVVWWNSEKKYLFPVIIYPDRNESLEDKITSSNIIVIFKFMSSEYPKIKSLVELMENNETKTT